MKRPCRSRLASARSSQGRAAACSPQRTSAAATSDRPARRGRKRTRARRAGARTCSAANRAAARVPGIGPKRRQAVRQSRRPTNPLGERAPCDPVVVPGAHVVQVPELEGPLRAARAVGRPQLVDAVVVEQAALGKRGLADLALRPLAELPAEPLADGRAEALLLAIRDLARDHWAADGL